LLQGPSSPPKTLIAEAEEIRHCAMESQAPGAFDEPIDDQLERARLPITS